MIPQAQSSAMTFSAIEPLPSKTPKMDRQSETVRGVADGIEAVKQAVYLALNTERYEWLVHSWNYGVELRDLIGKDTDYCIPEIERRVREALLQDDRITAVENFKFTVDRKRVSVTFTVLSTLGTFDTEMGVEI